MNKDIMRRLQPETLIVCPESLNGIREKRFDVLALSLSKVGSICIWGKLRHELGREKHGDPRIHKKNTFSFPMKKMHDRKIFGSSNISKSQPKYRKMTEK